MKINGSIYEVAIFTHEGVLLEEQHPEPRFAHKVIHKLHKYEDIEMEFTNPVNIKIKTANHPKLWYHNMLGQTLIAEAVNKGKTVPFNDYLTLDGKVLNYTDCEAVE